MKRKNNIQKNLVMAIAVLLMNSVPLLSRGSSDKDTKVTETVKTKNGWIQGTTVAGGEQPFHIFNGIPYAAPPVGPLRFTPPHPVTPLAGSSSSR